MKIVIDRIGETSFSTVSPNLMAAIRENLNVVFLTVDPNVETKHSVKRRYKNKDVSVKVPYKYMTHEEQYGYLQMYMNRVYIDIMDHTDWIYMIYELTKANNMHVHALLFSKELQSDYDLNALRKTVYSHPLTIVNMSKKGPKRIDYMNEIVFWNKDIKHITEYFTKDISIKRTFPDKYIEK